MANFYRIGAAGLNWKNTGSWSTTSGGASNGVDEPSSSDAVLFDTNSPATVTVNAAASGASLSLNKASLVITLNGGSITISGTTTLTTNASTIDKTASETFSTTGIAANTSITGTAKIILTGGTWSGSNTTGIANDLDIQGNVTVSGNVYYNTGTLTYVSGTITATSSTLNLTGSCTLNTNGMSWNNIGTTANAPTITLTSNFTATNLFTCFNSGTPNTNTTTINSTTTETWSCGGITCNNRVAGTAKIILTGGTWSSGLNSTTLYISNNLDISGNVTVSNNVSYNTGTLTYVSGTITVTSSTLNITGSCTLNTNGMSWNNINFTAAATLTLTSTCTGLGTLNSGSNSAVINKTASEKIIVAGLPITGSGQFSGTATIQLTGGTWSNAASNTISNDLEFNGNVTVSGTVNYQTGTITFISGTISTGTSTLSLINSCTLDTNGISWYNANTQGSATITINSLFTVTNTFDIAGATFSGTAGFTTKDLTNTNTAAVTISFKESVTYTITGGLTCKNSRTTAIVLFTSAHASTKAIITLVNNGTSSCNVLASFTRIDASAGRSINTFGGTITDCNNVVQFYDRKTAAN